METVKRYLPGCALALVIAVIAKLLERLENAAGLQLIGASVIALFIGMLVNRFYPPNAATKPGIRLTSKKILKFAIILLGASLNIRTVLTVGRFSLTVMVFTLATCFGLGVLIGKALGLNWKTSSLINAGTGICGGSAIAAIAPVIDATDLDIAYGMSATFLFDMVMILAFPLLGRWLGLSDAAFGLWAGTAVNDTSSVVAAGYAFSEGAGDFATMVKLTRTLAIIPTVVVFSFVSMHLKKKEAAASGGAVQIRWKSVFPWFILGFLAMAVLSSVGVIPAAAAAALKRISKFLMVTALAAVGDYTTAAQAFSAATQDASYATPFKAYLGLGNALFQSGDYANAGTAFRQAAIDGANPAPAAALGELGRCFHVVRQLVVHQIAGVTMLAVDAGGRLLTMGPHGHALGSRGGKAGDGGSPGAGANQRNIHDSLLLIVGLGDALGK